MTRKKKPKIPTVKLSPSDKGLRYILDHYILNDQEQIEQVGDLATVFPDILARDAFEMVIAEGGVYWFILDGELVLKQAWAAGIEDED